MLPAGVGVLAMFSTLKGVAVRDEARALAAAVEGPP